MTELTTWLRLQCFWESRQWKRDILHLLNTIYFGNLPLPGHPLSAKNCPPIRIAKIQTADDGQWRQKRIYGKSLIKIKGMRILSVYGHADDGYTDRKNGQMESQLLNTCARPFTLYAKQCFVYKSIMDECLPQHVKGAVIWHNFIDKQEHWREIIHSS